MQGGDGEGEAWMHYPHDADIGVRGFGARPADAFANAARALTAAMTPLGAVAVAETVTVSCRAPDLEVLFYDWMNAVIYEMATRRMIFVEFRVAITGDGLEAELGGEPVDRFRHAPAVEPKGATWTGLSVTQDPAGRWVAECIVDV